MFIDSHLHLYAEEFDTDREEVIESMIHAGVGRAILPDIDNETRYRMLELVDHYPDHFFPLVGLHPTSVMEAWKTEIKRIEHLLGTRKFYGIGECGIDLYWDKTYYKEQIAAFEYQLGMASDCNLAVVIHARESMPEIFKSIAKFPKTKGVLHCFSGNEQDARRAIDQGYFLGIGGVLTYKKSMLPAIIESVGVESLLLETDAPYLAPVPHRGKRNESSFIPIIAAKLSEILGMTIEEIATVTTKNCEYLFGLESIKPAYRE